MSADMDAPPAAVTTGTCGKILRRMGCFIGQRARILKKSRSVGHRARIGSGQCVSLQERT